MIMYLINADYIDFCTNINKFRPIIDRVPFAPKRAQDEGALYSFNFSLQN